MYPSIEIMVSLFWLAILGTESAWVPILPIKTWYSEFQNIRLLHICVNCLLFVSSEGMNLMFWKPIYSPLIHFKINDLILTPLQCKHSTSFVFILHRTSQLLFICLTELQLHQICKNIIYNNDVCSGMFVEIKLSRISISMIT